MQFYLLTPQYSPSGDTVYRSVGAADADIDAMTDWYLRHQHGRGVTQKTFGVKRFCWRDSVRKPVADFPSSGEPGGVFSDKAVGELRAMLERSGDLYELSFDDPNVQYHLFDCWVKLDGVPNAGFNMLQPETLKRVVLEGDHKMVDVAIVRRIPGLLVSEKFKSAAEEAGLSGMAFFPVEIAE